MVRPGLHFPQKLMTLVLRNGATVQVSTIVNVQQPIFLDKDPTNHPDWTGREVREIKEESRAAKFIAKFGRRRIRTEEPPASDNES